MRIVKCTFFLMMAVSLWSCNKSSSNERYIVNSSQKTIYFQRGYDRNNIYSSTEILPGDTTFLEYQSTSGKWDMKTPMYSDYYYYYDSIFILVPNGYTLNKDVYNFNDWTSYLTDATTLPSEYYFTSYFFIRESDITP